MKNTTKAVSQKNIDNLTDFGRMYKWTDKARKEWEVKNAKKDTR